jgi:hypothetical protein
MADIKANLFELFGYTRTTIATQAETRLFFDVRQRDKIRPLPAAGRTVAESTQAAWADVHHATHPPNGKRRPVLFDKLKPHGFWLAKNTVAFLRNSPVSFWRQFL